MPIEIRELHIKAIVGNSGETTDSQTPERASKSKNMNVESIVAECVEQVMDILKEKQER